MDIVFYSLLVHHILSRELGEDRGDDSMNFRLNEHNVNFSKDEFLLVIELWRSLSPVEVDRNVKVIESIRMKYFCNLVSMKIILTAFKQHNTKNYHS